MTRIRRCDEADFESIFAIINAAAQKYRGLIPKDRWHDPYMPAHALRREIDAGVNFSGVEEKGELIGVMGLQPVRDAMLIRHAYVRPDQQGKGVGGALLRDFRGSSDRPILIGTWAAADWAIRFYEGHGFKMVSSELTPAILRTYWSIPDEQVQASVVLTDTPLQQLTATLG